MPHEFLNTSISEFCSFPPRAQLSFYCSGYIHFVISLPLCLLLVNIKYLLLLYSFTSSALLSHTAISPLFLHSVYFKSSRLTGEKGPFRFSPLHACFWWFLSSSSVPAFFFLSLVAVNSNTLLSTPNSLFTVCFHSVHIASIPFPISLSPFPLSHAFVPNPPPPPPLCMLKYSVKEGSRGGTGGECMARRGGIGGGGGGNVDVKSAAVVMIFCSLFLGTSCPFRATVSSTVFTGSWRGEEEEGGQCWKLRVYDQKEETLQTHRQYQHITCSQLPLSRLLPLPR